MKHPPIPPLKPVPHSKSDRVFLFHRRNLSDRISPRINRSRYKPASNVIELFPLSRA